MKNSCEIGIAIPCHVDDELYLQKCLPSLWQLNPQPAFTFVNLNKGQHSLKIIHEQLFDSLFDFGCDVVLRCAADFWLFPNILSYVSSDTTTSFAYLERRFFPSLTMTMIHCFYPQSWTGCYSLPKRVWTDVVKPSWNGTDGSIKEILGNNYKFVKKPLYYAMRPWRAETTQKLLNTMSLPRKFKWRLIRLR